jgi:bifunctional non-homologous end joining protein LigD
MLASPGGTPFSSPDWLYEIKFDGYRCLALVDAGQVQLRTKSGTDCTAWYPEVAEALATLPGGPHVIDAEACVLDEIGRSDFNLLHERAARRRWYAGCSAVTLCAFDLLFEHGRNVMGLPLVERKRRLQLLLAGAPGVLFVSDLPAQAEIFAQAVEPLKLEGLVAKRRASVYNAGVRSPDWLKIKRRAWQDGRRWRN